MKITCISDTHSLHRKVNITPTDLLLFGGDAMTSGYDKNELIDFLDWFSSCDAKYRVMIAGNHCRYIENHPTWFRDTLKLYPNIIYLEDDWVEIEGLKIYGTPHSKEFYNWAFNRTEEQLKELFGKIPLDIDVLVSHAPQYGVLDELVDGRQVGEFSLSKQIRKIKNLKLHVFGHIHNGYGMIKRHGQKYYSVNASQVDENYDLVNNPIIIEI